MAIKNIPITDKQKSQLVGLGLDETEINQETLVELKLWQQAMNGNVQALRIMQNKLEDKIDENDVDVQDISKEVEQEEQIIMKNLKGLSNVQIELNMELIHQVAFQSVQLRYLSEDISKHGVKEKYKNGANQWGYKDRAEVKTYNTMIKSYQSCMKQLNDLISNNYLFDESDEFDEFNS